MTAQRPLSSSLFGARPGRDGLGHEIRSVIARPTGTWSSRMSDLVRFLGGEVLPSLLSLVALLAAVVLSAQLLRALQIAIVRCARTWGRAYRHSRRAARARAAACRPLGDRADEIARSEWARILETGRGAAPSSQRAQRRPKTADRYVSPSEGASIAANRSGRTIP